MFNFQSERVKVEGTNFLEFATLYGRSFASLWRENAVAASTSEYSEFVVPPDSYLILKGRIVNTEVGPFKYRVYPSGTYTLGADKTDDQDSFVKTRNLRLDGVLSLDPLRRVNVTVEPNVIDAVVYEDEYETGQQGSDSFGSLFSSSSFLILPPDSQFLLELSNGNGTGSASVELEYALVEAKDMPKPSS